MMWTNKRCMLKYGVSASASLTNPRSTFVSFATLDPFCGEICGVLQITSPLFCGIVLYWIEVWGKHLAEAKCAYIRCWGPCLDRFPYTAPRPFEKSVSTFYFKTLGGR